MDLTPFYKNRPIMIMVVITILLIIMMILTAGDRSSITGAENIIGGIISPLQGVMYGISTGISDFFGGIINQKDIEKEYATVKKNESALILENQRLKEIEKENKRLKDLLSFSENHPEFKTIGAKVTGKNPGNWFNVLIIDKGSQQGVSKDMTVVTDKGLVGRVIESGLNWSKVMCTIDSRSSVSGIIERTRDNGIVRGTNTMETQNGLCKMIYLPLETDLIPGDKVLTSGLGGIFPKGILIGEVKEVSRQENELQKYAIIKPSVDFLHIEEVLVTYSNVEKIKVE